MPTPYLFAGTVCAFLSVALGAFGAHGLKHLVSPEMLEVFKTGVTYQMWHALALILVALLQLQQPSSALLQWAARLFLAGIIVFSGSLYLLVLLEQKWLGMITPLGGMAFLAGWACLTQFARKTIPPLDLKHF